MLTVNSGILPHSKTKFQPKIQNKNNFAIFDFISNNKLERTPAEDTFVKAGNVSFSGKNRIPVIGRPDYENYDYEYFKALKVKMDEAWEWAQHQEKYAEYFKDIKIEKPALLLTEQEEILKNDSKEGEVATYSWMSNEITVNKTFSPNLLLISGGEIAFVPQILAHSFITKQSKGTNARYKEYTDIGKKNLEMLIDNTRKSEDERYFYKLSPKDAAELAMPYIIHELDHAIVAHILYNTSGLTSYQTQGKRGGNHAFEPYFEKLKSRRRLPDQVPTEWKKTYTYRYKPKEPGKYIYNADDIWEIKTNTGRKKAIKLKSVLPMMHKPIKEHRSNLLELSGQCAALEFLEDYKLKSSKDKQRDAVMELLLEYQKQTFREDVEERAR